MALILFSDQETLLAQATTLQPDGLVALLTTEQSTLRAPLQAQVADLIVVDVQGPRLSRLNFDALRMAFVDLPSKLLLSSGGRRLLDALGGLASAPTGKDALTLCFYGPAITATGAFLDDGVTAGLNLLPQTVLVPDLSAVSNLNMLLAHMSTQGLRLLALDRPASATYDYATDTVTARGDGHVLLMAFHQATGDPQPTARLQTLKQGMKRGWLAR